MYRDKAFRVRDLDETLADIRTAGERFGENVTKVFVADGDALVLDLPHWEAILPACRDAFPRMKRVSAYATAMNVNEKSSKELKRLRELGLSLLYMGPETGDDVTFNRIAKGSNFDEHVEAARRTHDVGMKVSAIFLLGASGTERTEEHAADSALTLTIIPGTPIAKMHARGKFTLPSVTRMLEELRTIVTDASPSDAVFRTNHASNYLPLAGRLPQDRERIVSVLDKALAGDVALRPEWSRGL
jgi:radical SAM superfamily enzyme YgiQ (UPF0313 family)